LRTLNRSLMDENRRLTDLTRMLLSSSSFSTFLEHLSANPAAVSQQSQAQQPAPKAEQRQQEMQQLPKDVNPYAVAQPSQAQQIGMVMMPEQNMDFSMLNLESDAFNYQPQVFSVLETPELPEIDTSILSGKSSNVVEESLSSDDEKLDAPALESPLSPSIEEPSKPADTLAAETPVVDLDGDIYDDDIPASTTPVRLETESLFHTDLFGGIEPEKALARYELVDISEEEAAAEIAVRRVNRLYASLESSLATIARMTDGL
jgi:bZIP-type transcription factor MBZ1